MNTDERIEVILDTNVLVTAALSDGPPDEILAMAEEGAIVSVTAPAIVDEFVPSSAVTDTCGTT